jgi:hypothetical protein
MSAGATLVTVTLSSDPGRRICVPFVRGVSEGAQRRLDIVPAPLIVDPALNELVDEGTPLPGPNSSV